MVPSSFARPLPSLALRVAAAFVLAVLFLVTSFGSLMAGPYDGFNSRPGDRITNTATLTYRHNGDPMPPLETGVTFIVRHFPPQGTIRAFERFRGFGTQERFATAQGLWSPSGSPQGPFVPMPIPTDSSALTGGETYPVPGTLGLRETSFVRQGVPVFFAITDPTLNIDGTQIDRISVVITDSITGDTETIVFFETAPDSGIFMGWINTIGAGPGVRDGVLWTARGSRITATYNDPQSAELSLSVGVDVLLPTPEGQVFDSVTGALLNNIPLTLINATTGQPAIVRSEDLRASVPATIRTGTPVTDSLGRTITPSRGGFVFPYVEPGNYQLVLGRIATHTGPSVRSNEAINALPGAPWDLEAGSRLDVFTLAMGEGIRFDVPLDPVLGRPDVVRSGSLQKGAVGDVFEYTIEITPPSADPITFRDEIPTGIRFIPGTFLIDGQPWVPEVSEDGRFLIFRDVPVQAAGIPVVLTYGARIATETAFQSWTRLMVDGRYGPSDDHTLIVEDAFDLNSIAILGEITAGACGTAPQERDLSNIRVLLENGEFALTDARGMFSFRDIARKPRVVQVDTNTLPVGASLVLCQSNTRAAGSALSRFVDVAPGHLARVDFRVVFDDTVVAAAETTRAAAEAPVERTSPFDRYTENWFATQGPNAPIVLAPGADFAPASESLEIVFVRASNERMRIEINGEEAKPSVQQPSVANAGGSLYLERWGGVRIPQGKSQLTFITSDALTGAEMRRETRTVAFATRPGRLTLDAESGALHTSGQGLAMVRLRVTDREGTPVRAGTRAQFSIQAPFQFLARPPRDSAPGYQRRPVSTIDAEIGRDGLVTLELAPVRAPGKATISITTDTGPLSVSVPVRLDARPWVFVGLAEGTIAADTVRQNLQQIGTDRNPYTGRIAFYTEGVIKGKWLLTARYDSQQDERSFYGIDPDKEYLVYGDRSIQGNDAQGRFPLYVRLRSDEAEILLGDFDLDIDTMLIQDNRKLTGLRGLYETETVKVMAFVAQTDQSYARDRIALNGTVGPYTLTRGDVVPNSESISLVTVSRLDATRELNTQALLPGQDYVIDYATGRVWLRNPISAFTPTLDRRVLVIDYETDAGTLPSRLAGVRVERTLGARTRVGGTLIHAQRVDGQNVNVTLAGMDITYTIDAQTIIKAEAIEVRKRFVDGTTQNRAAQIEITHQSPVAELYARYRVQKGDITLTSDRDTDTVDILTVGASRRLSGPDDAPEQGIFLEAGLTWERNRTSGEEQRLLEALRLKRTANGTWGGGLSWSSRTNEDGTQEEDLASVGRAEWYSLDGRMRQGLEMRNVLWSKGDESHHTLALSAEYDATETVTVFARVDAQETTDRTEHDTAATLGVKLRPWSEFEGIVALSHADHTGAGSWNLYSSALQGIPVGPHGILTFGADMQRTVGANAAPFGADLGNPYVEEAFKAARIGYRSDTEERSFGIDAEVRDGEESGETANLRIRADGVLSNGWAVGGEAFAGTTKALGEDRNEIEIRFAAAERRYGRQPITLFQAELVQEDDGTTPRTTLYGSVQHNRFIGTKGELGARYAARHTSTELTSGTFSSLTQYAGLEYRHDINERLDLGLQGAVMHDSATSTWSESFGASIGVVPFDNSWVSIGYNIKGFEGEQFAEDGATQEGPFVQFRWKLDQNTIASMFRP